MAPIKSVSIVLLSGLALFACESFDDGVDFDAELRAKPAGPAKLEGARNLHFEAKVEFITASKGADADKGRELFGVAEDLETAHGLPIAEFGDNERTCFTCHRGMSQQFGIDIPKGGELSDVIPEDDPIFTGIEADAQGDPDGFKNLNKHALFKYRFHRFDPRPKPGGFKDLFAWRKSLGLMNFACTKGALNDGRMPGAAGADRGAVSSHTQEADTPIDNLLSDQYFQDMEAFQLSLFTDKRLAGLLDPKHQLHDALIKDPYLTVDIKTPAQKAGRRVFDRYCYVCHNTPNVFSGLDGVSARGNGERPSDRPSWAPSVTKTYNIGTAEWNRHKLRFTKDLDNGEFETIVIPLAKEDGSVVHHQVTFDVGLAASTGRHEDLGRFKVPQLRGLEDNAPYFHDNSADTIEEVVDYFNSDQYNNSADGQNYPIHLTPKEIADLLEFLYIL
ncbi:MAG: hypothetical protein R6X02_14395 [Enhygromyxa sp.]